MFGSFVFALGVLCAEPPAEAAPPVADPPSPAPVAQPEAEPPAPQRPASLETTAAAAPEATPAAAPAAPAAEPAVPEAAWAALKGQRVVIETKSGPIEGEVASAEGDQVVLFGEDGRVQTISKADATGVQVAKAPQPSAAAEPPAAPAKSESSEDDDKEKSREEKRKERREKRKHAILGAFTAHGAGYAHWRGDGVRAGHAAYLMDWGIGANLSPGFGMYAMAGGTLAARLSDKSINANYGRVAFMFAFGGKYYFSMVGAGVGFSRLRFKDENDRLEKDVGLALPMRLFGKIPLPKKLYIGIGLSYDLGLVRNFNRAVNSIGGQIIFGRW